MVLIIRSYPAFLRLRAYASVRIRTHPYASVRIRTHPRTPASNAALPLSTLIIIFTLYGY